VLYSADLISLIESYDLSPYLYARCHLDLDEIQQIATQSG